MLLQTGPGRDAIAKSVVRFTSPGRTLNEGTYSITIQEASPAVNFVRLF